MVTWPDRGHVAEFVYDKYLVLPSTLLRCNRLMVFALITFRQNTNPNFDKPHLICHRSVPKSTYELLIGSACDRLLLGQGSSEIELCVNK